MSELKPCLHCGSSDTYAWGEHGGYRARCKACGIMTQLCKTEKEAIDSFNSKADNWTKITDDPKTLPKDNHDVLLFRFGLCSVGFYTGQTWVDTGTSCEVFPTHWQPLPEPPKENG